MHTSKPGGWLSWSLVQWIYMASLVVSSLNEWAEEIFKDINDDSYCFKAQGIIISKKYDYQICELKKWIIRAIDLLNKLKIKEKILNTKYNLEFKRDEISKWIIKILNYKQNNINDDDKCIYSWYNGTLEEKEQIKSYLRRIEKFVKKYKENSSINKYLNKNKYFVEQTFDWNENIEKYYDYIKLVI